VRKKEGSISFIKLVNQVSNALAVE